MRGAESRVGRSAAGSPVGALVGSLVGAATLRRLSAAERSTHDQKSVSTTQRPTHGGWVSANRRSTSGVGHSTVNSRSTTPSRPPNGRLAAKPAANPPLNGRHTDLERAHPTTQRPTRSRTNRQPRRPTADTPIHNVQPATRRPTHTGSAVNSVQRPTHGRECALGRPTADSQPSQQPTRHPTADTPTQNAQPTTQRPTHRSTTPNRPPNGRLATEPATNPPLNGRHADPSTRHTDTTRRPMARLGISQELAANQETSRGCAAPRRRSGHLSR